jgi:HAD superfamily hydrolase (TIGR01509 family)
VLVTGCEAARNQHEYYTDRFKGDIFMNSLAVIFDMDGLMLDTERMARKAWTRALSEHGMQLDEPSYLRMVGRTVQDAELILEEIFGSALPFISVFNQRQLYYEQDIAENGIPMKPGLLELLSFLEEKQIVKAVGTSTPCWFATVKLEHAQLSQRFSTVVCGDDVARGKPAPDLFLEAARRIGFAPEQCIVLEDSEAGILAAASAGMLPIMIPDIKQPTAEIQEIAYRILPSLCEVIPLIDHLRCQTL